MPEGDTLYKLAAYLAPRLEGRPILRGFAGHPPVDLGGARIAGVRVNGKHLFIDLEDGRVIRSHLGMWGSWHRYPEGTPWQHPAKRARILLDLGEEAYVCFSPKDVELMRDGAVRARVVSATLGPDLLAAELDLGRILVRARELSGPDRIIADVLLDQRIAGGIGNVYKSEVLFLEGIAPSTDLGHIDDEQLGALYRRARRLLEANRGPGPRDTRQAGDGGRLWVYGRRGEPCLTCGARVRYARLGRHQRSTYWCPRCQAGRPTGPSAVAPGPQAPE